MLLWCGGFTVEDDSGSFWSSEGEEQAIVKNKFTKYPLNEFV